MILSGGMSRRSAERCLSDTPYSKPYLARVEFIEGLAALASAFQDEMDKVAPGPNKRVRQILACAAEADRIEWYLNNVRVRARMDPDHLTLLPSGTSSNEALHAELNVAFRQTQALHQATLHLKLLCITFAKQVSHESAMYYPAVRQVMPSIVLARADPFW